MLRSSIDSSSMLIAIREIERTTMTGSQSEPRLVIIHLPILAIDFGLSIWAKLVAMHLA